MWRLSTCSLLLFEPTVNNLSVIEGYPRVAQLEIIEIY